MSEIIQKNNTNIMETGNVKKTLISLGIPAMVAMMISVIYNFVDTMFIGQLNNTASMGAVTVAFPIFMIISAIGQMIGVGSSSYVSRMLGNKKNDVANKTASIAVILSIACAILTTTVGLLFLKQILTMMGSSETVLPEGIKYTKWLLLGSIFTLLNMSLSSLVRAEGNSKASMVSLIVGAIVNIILDPIFMFSFGWGISGASLATLVGQVCSTVYLLMYYIKKKSIVNISLKHISKNPVVDKNIYAEIFKIGVPVFLMQFLLSIASSLLNSAAMPYGDSAVAAMGVANRVYTLPVYLMAGFIQGFQPFAAYNYGAGLYKRLNEAIKFTGILLVGFSILFTIIFVSVPELFVGMFTSDNDVLLLGCNALTALSLLFPFVAVILIVTAIFQGMGKGKESAIISVARQGLIFIPMALILPNVFANYGSHLGFMISILPNEMPQGLYGVMLTQPVADIIAAVLTILICIKPFRELKNLECKTSDDICNKPA